MTSFRDSVVRGWTWKMWPVCRLDIPVDVPRVWPKTTEAPSSSQAQDSGLSLRQQGFKSPRGHFNQLSSFRKMVG